MIELNEDNKKDYTHRWHFIKSNKVLRIFIQIIRNLLVLLIFLFAVYLAVGLYATLYLVLYPVAHALHNCLIGLIIGCIISYALQESKYASRKILFILIFLSSLSAWIIYSPYLTRLDMDLYETLFHRQIDIHTFCFCLVCLGLIVFIFYRKNRYLNVFLISIILLIYLAICIIYKLPTIPEYARCADNIQQSNNMEQAYNMESGIKLQQMYLLFFFFLSLIIIEAILYEVKKRGLPDKKKIFIWILLCSFITYLSFSIIYYILAPEEFGTAGYWNFLYTQLKNNCNPQIGYRHFIDSAEPAIEDEISTRLLDFFEFFTFHKVSFDNLVILLTILRWIAEFLITSLCAWKYITYTYFSPLSSKFLQGQKD